MVIMEAKILTHVKLATDSVVNVLMGVTSHVQLVLMGITWNMVQLTVQPLALMDSTKTQPTTSAFSVILHAKLVPALLQPVSAATWLLVLSFI